MFTNLVSVAVVVLVINLSSCWARTTCQDNTGEQVDWFVIYKLPKLRDSSDPLTQEGLGYYYLDVNSQNWTLGKVSLNDSGQALYNTLQQVYDNVGSKEMMFLFYNDETPEKKVSYTHGHTKGDVAFDKTSGFWLVHSLPRFPPYSNQSYHYPKSGLDYGQTFLCVTYPTIQLETIAQQMLYTYPQIYDHSLPAEFNDTSKFPTLAKVVQGKHVLETAPQNASVVLKSTGGQHFTSYAKFTDFDQDLYDSWVAPALGSRLYAETWQNGVGVLPSNCSAQYRVYNVEHLNVAGTEFNGTRDHSKWAVTVDTGHQYICIGDINRMDSQKKRAGGTVCSQLPHVWNAFKSSVTKWEDCSNYTLPQN